MDAPIPTELERICSQDNPKSMYICKKMYLQEQYLEDFLNLKVDRDKVFLGSGLVGGEYTEPVAMV